ncbi:hypothetical protein KJ359_005429 [Pestalotiopsis sp. 9143b]|nr:hypothetical protein KJ359_005429 [Pestalotiopsis sp. 9143b]
MVFLHGGAFAYAAGSAAMYDGRVLADISRDSDMPTIIITLNYRLGILGFLASRELLKYNQDHGEDGVGNYGIWDQIEALKWIQEHIAAFGGDPSRVTLFGQSAGSVSTNIHLARNEPLFSSAILQSGLMPLCGIMTVDEYQVVYEKTLKVLGISEDLPPAARLEQLLATDEARLTATMPEVFMTPVVTLALCDDSVLHPGPMPRWNDFGDFEVPAWCQRIMIGDAKNECIIWNKSYRHMNYQDYLERGTQLIGQANVLQLFGLYGITETLSRQALFEAIEKFTTDAMYLAPNYDAMRANPQSYAYHFDEPSPYDNEWNGLAHHSLDNVFIWSVLRGTLPAEQQRQSERMANLWLTFAAGHRPWEEFGGEGHMMVFAGGRATLETATSDSQRGYRIWQRIKEIGLTQAWGEFSHDICIMRHAVLDINFEPKAMEVTSSSSEAGVANVL